MTAMYRTGNHHGITIVREGDGARCSRPDHDCDRGHLVAVVVDGDEESAERICALLNGESAALAAVQAALYRWEDPDQVCDAREFHEAIRKALQPCPAPVSLRRPAQFGPTHSYLDQGDFVPSGNDAYEAPGFHPTDDRH